MGIDPGSLITGFGVVENTRNSIAYIHHGEIKSPRNCSLPPFLVDIYEQLMAAIRETKPDAVAIEDIFYGKNVKSLIKQGHVRGVALLAASRSGLPVHEYSPLEVKKAVVGYGRAEKQQVQVMIQAILCLKEILPEDASDALAVAICHTNTKKEAVL